ncbi:MAG: CPBP family glutamic-type intramembrane protease [Alphaproteobacteria bacterium]|nr:CPBP family glutamic-type intramembrane protease [Alphaproteobacteria bacterium]
MVAINTVIAETLVLAGMCLIAALLLRGRVSWGWMLGAIGLYAVHKVAVFLPIMGLVPDLTPGRYNWEGKLLGVILVLLVGWLVFRGDLRSWGLTLSQRGPAPAAGFIVAGLTALAMAAFMYLYFPGVKSEPALDVAYQMTMPSLDEEFLYRGVMLVMLERAFRPTFRLFGAPLGFAALITTLQFYATHAMGVGADWTLTMAWFDIVSLITGALYVYVRAATGSLLLPILLHSWFNCAGYLM